MKTYISVNTSEGICFFHCLCLKASVSIHCNCMEKSSQYSRQNFSLDMRVNYDRIFIFEMISFSKNKGIENLAKIVLATNLG